MRQAEKKAGELRDVILQLGVHLAEVKREIGHGNYLAWLRDTVNKNGPVISESKAVCL